MSKKIIPIPIIKQNLLHHIFIEAEEIEKTTFCVHKLIQVKLIIVSKEETGMTGSMVYPEYEQVDNYGITSDDGIPIIRSVRKPYSKEEALIQLQKIQDAHSDLFIKESGILQLSDSARLLWRDDPNSCVLFGLIQ